MNMSLIATGLIEELGTWRTYIATMLLAGVGAYCLTPFAHIAARRWGAMDVPNARKIHKSPMPRLGGLAVFGGFCSPWAALYLLDNRVTATFQNYEKLFASLLLGSFAMLLLGVYDDIRGADARKKFAIQIVVSLGLYAAGYRITALSLPFGQPAQIQLHWLSLPVSILWMVGVTNAINLLDGIDGLATGVTACIAICLGVINMMTGNIFVALLTMCLAGACLGFLPHNFAPARIFLGDSGSLSIGMLLGCIGVISLFKAATVTFLAVPLLIFGLPLFDTASVMVGRWLRGVPIFQADKTHVHHRLLALGLSQKQAAMALYSVAVLLGALGVVLTLRTTPQLLAIASLVTLSITICTWIAWRAKTQRDREEAAEATAATTTTTPTTPSSSSSSPPSQQQPPADPG